MTEETVLAGYRRNTRGHLIPESQIKPIDAARDELVQQLVERAKQLQADLAKFRGAAFGDIEAFVSLSAEEYGVKIGGSKGNVQLISFDGRYKVLRARQESIMFDERLQAAKALIDECLQEWTVDARAELATLVQDAFNVDSAGNIKTGSVLGLRKLGITDPRWQRAMQAISDAVQVVGSKTYLRVYERDARGEYQPISLDIAAVTS